VTSRARAIEAARIRKFKPGVQLNPRQTPYTFRRGAPPPISPAGLHVPPASISEPFFWIATALCAVAQVAVVRAALAGRTPGASASTVSKVREFFWVLLPAALLVLLLTWTWRSLPGRAADHSADTHGAATSGATATDAASHDAPIAAPADFKVKT
jgi:hypothetical protein